MISQIRRSLPAVLFFTGLSFVFPAQSAERIEELAKMLPASVGVIICIKNTSEAIKDWDASGIGRFMDDPAAKKWMAPMYEKDGEPVWNKSMKEQEGLSFRDGIAVYPGAVAVGFDFSGRSEEGGKGASHAAISDIAGNEDKLTASKAATLEAKRKKFPDIIMKTADVGGTKVSIIAEDDSEDAKWIEAWVVIDGVLVEASDEAMMEQAINSTKSGGEAVKRVEHLAKLAELNGGTSDVTVLIDFAMVTQMLKKKIAKDGDNTGVGAVSPSMLLNALGLDELKAAAVTVDFEDARSSASFILLHDEKPKGILPTMFRGTSTEVPQPAFLPASADQASVTRQSIGRIYDVMLETVQKLGPMAAMLTMQLTQMEQKAGVSLRNDLFGSFDDVLAQAQTIKVGPAGLPEMSQVTAIKLKDRARFQSALDAVMALLGNGFVILEDSEIEGQKVHTLKLPSMAAGTAPKGQPAAGQLTYTVTDDYLLYCQGSHDMLQKILNRMKSKTADGSIWETPAAHESLAALPKGYTGMSVSNGASIMQTMAGLLTNIQTITAAGDKASTGKVPKAPRSGAKGGAVAEKSSGFSFDPKAMPGEEVFARYFGTAAGGNYSGSDSTMFRIIALPAVAK